MLITLGRTTYNDPMNTDTIFRLWSKLQSLPGGKCLFSFILSRSVRYSGSICPQVLRLEAGWCQIEMRDRPKLRNHLRSIHAVALTNLGELCSGLACLSSLPKDSKAIVKSFSIDFHRKARGKIRAESRVSFGEIHDDQDLQVSARLVNSDNEPVATFSAVWNVRKPLP